MDREATAVRTRRPTEARHLVQAVSPCVNRAFATMLFVAIVTAFALVASTSSAAPIATKNKPPLACPNLQDFLRVNGAVKPEERARLYGELAQSAKLLQAQASVVKTVARLVRPTVVHLEADVTTTAQRQRGRQIEEAGSGVIINYKGKYYILTNAHVVRGARLDRIKITLSDGRLLTPQRALLDPATDVGVLVIQADGLIAAPIGSSGKLEIGDFVLAVGSPFGLSESVTFGIISAKGRRDLELGQEELRFQDFMQTDAAINPGNSGGPLIDLNGQLVGINTAIASNSGGNEGIGFVIPIDMAMVVAKQLIETGKVTRAFLGISLDARYGAEKATERGLPCPIGAHVTVVRPGGPAAQAGVKVGDIILQYDGIPMEDDAHLINQVGLTPVGSKVPVVVWRAGKAVNLEVQVGDRQKLESR